MCVCVFVCLCVCLFCLTLPLVPCPLSLVPSLPPLAQMAAPVPLAEFTRLLQAFLSPDGTTRNAAEAGLQTLLGSPDVLLLSLSQALHELRDEALRNLAAVLLRRMLLETDGVWAKLSPSSKATLKAALLACVAGDAPRSVRRSTTDTIADM